MSEAFPWDTDPWSFSPPSVQAPSPKAKTPRLLPAIDRLFQVQRNTLKVMNDIETLKAHIEKNPHAQAALRRLEQDAENAYRVIRSYLDKYADTEGGASL